MTCGQTDGVVLQMLLSVQLCHSEQMALRCRQNKRETIRDPPPPLATGTPCPGSRWEYRFPVGVRSGLWVELGEKKKKKKTSRGPFFWSSHMMDCSLEFLPSLIPYLTQLKAGRYKGKTLGNPTDCSASCAFPPQSVCHYLLSGVLRPLLFYFVQGFG